MLFSRRLSLSNLIDLCRALRHYLGAGLPLTAAFRQQANRGALAVRPVAGRIAAALERGDSLEDALKGEEGVFPPLFVALTRVGEQTGMQAELFADLEKYFLRQRTLWRQFVSQITWPVVEFVLAIFVLAGLILIMGMIADSRGGEPLDPLGLGLAGPTGAMIFLGVVFGMLAGLAGVYLLFTRGLRDNSTLDTVLLSVPALGPCLRALALTRFCMALRLTTETGMSIVKAMRLSLRATGNRAYVSRSESIEARLRSGDDLTVALTDPRFFPEDFQHMIAVAEESGTLHDVLAHQTNHYHEEAGRRLAALTAVAGYGVWLLVAIIIIIAIFRIYSFYLGQLG